MDLINSFEISGFNEILLLLIKLCWISWNQVKSCGFLKSSRFQFKSGGLQMHFRIWRFYLDLLQISSADFNVDYIMDFICRILWILWTSYELHLVPYDRARKSNESHLNQLFLQISFGFHEICQIVWNLADFIMDFMKSSRFHYGFLHWNLPDFMEKQEKEV